MDIITKPTNIETIEAIKTESKADVFRNLEPVIEKLMTQHTQKQKLWFSSDFLPVDELNDEDHERVQTKLRDRARSIPDEVRVGFALNLLTEEGLPHFHRLIASHVGENNILIRWNNLWTAEEDRHGCILRDYARDSRLFNFRELEKLQFDYMNVGFFPSWGKDPYKIFVYTSLQERATQFSHKNLGKRVGENEPLVKGILNSIAIDEAKHFTFYRNLFKAILEVDPNRALKSASDLMPSIDMPGIAMPNFREMADVAYRVGVYGPWDYKKIVEEAIEFWKIEAMTGLNEMGRMAQEKIMKIPQRLQKVAQYIDRRMEEKTFGFDFLHNRTFKMN